MVNVPIVSITLSQLCDLRVEAHLCLHGPELAESCSHSSVMWAAIVKVWRDIKNIRLHQSTHSFLKKFPAKFQSDPIWNNGALGFFEDGHPNKKNNNNMSSNSSVHDPNSRQTCLQHMPSMPKQCSNPSTQLWVKVGNDVIIFTMLLLLQSLSVLDDLLTHVECL